MTPSDSMSLSDRISALCQAAISTPESPELDDIVRQLQQALHEHVESLRQKVPGNATTAETRATP